MSRPERPADWAEAIDPPEPDDVDLLLGLTDERPGLFELTPRDLPPVIVPTYRCCGLARLADERCVCAAVTRCPEHGERHWGTHD